VALLVTKAALGFVLGRIKGQDTQAATRFALALPQGSEFSFVLFGAAVAVGALAQGQADRATLAVALSMAATPLLFAAGERWIVPRLERRSRIQDDVIDDATAPVIICGFGRVGQIVGRVLRMQGIAFTALEQDAAQVEVVRRFGYKVYFGNPGRADLLRAAGAETAKLLVVALDDPEEVLRVVDVAHHAFPNLRIIARARNRQHVHRLMDREVAGIVRDTFHSSLKLSELVLGELGIPAEDGHRTVALFQRHDERNLLETHAFYQDERKLVQTAQRNAIELAGLFEADQDRGRQLEDHKAASR
jgi:voltage-gated potassium channel Kch